MSLKKYLKKHYTEGRKIATEDSFSAGVDKMWGAKVKRTSRIPTSLIGKLGYVIGCINPDSELYRNEMANYRSIIVRVLSGE